MFRYIVKRVIDLKLLDKVLRQMGLFYEIKCEKETTEFDMDMESANFVTARKFIISIDLSPIEYLRTYYDIDIEDEITKVMMRIEELSKE